MSDGQALVLVVDDNEMNRDMLSRRLERQGYRAILAEDGIQALELLPQHPFDLVLLDIMMPRMNGYEVLEQAKNNPLLRNIPIIMISAVDDLDSVVKCVEMGADDYLFKPFNPILLKARISASLEKKRLRDQEQLFLEQLKSGDESRVDSLPSSVAARIRHGDVVADHFDAVTVLYAAVVGIDRVSEGFSAGEMVGLLNSVFGEFDAIADDRDAYPVKTIGNSYMVAAGAPLPAENHTQLAVELAFNFLDSITRWKIQSGGPLGLQIGLHTGPAIGGVIRGKNTMSYDLWGEAVTLAGIAQDAAPIDAILCTAAVAKNLGDDYLTEKSGEIMHQGKMMSVYLVRRR